MKIFVRASIAVVATGLAATQTYAAFPADVQALLDPTVEPCDDFYQYACGGWIKNYTVPADRQGYAYAINGISERNEVAIQQIIKEDWPLVGELWESCMDTSALTKLGNKPLQKDLARIGSVTTKKDLMRVAGELTSVGASLFTTLGVYPDGKDAMTNVLYTSAAQLVLYDPTYYLDDTMFAELEPPLRKYISTLVKLAGITTGSGSSQQQGQQAPGSPVDPKYAEDVVVSIEKQLAAIYVRDEERSEYYALTYRDAAAKFPFTFQAMTQGTGVQDKSSLTGDSTVVFETLPFMERVEALFNKLELKDLKIYYAFLYANTFAEYLGEPFVEASFDLMGRALQGALSQPKRTRLCTDAQTTLLPDLIGKYYFLKMFDVEREQSVKRMVAAIEHAMGDHIATLHWLDDATRKQAADKLSKVANLIGHSTQKRNYPFVLSRDNYFSNVQLIRSAWFQRDLKKINTRVDRSEWHFSAATINAYYSPSENTMAFPAAILQPPFFNGGSHPAQNFGAIGAVIGHELTHGFDSRGRHYDGDGNQREWWTQTTAQAFEARAQCMKDQYSGFVAYGDSGKPVGMVNGNLTISENIADNGGASVAFDAFHSWLASSSDAAYSKNGVRDGEEADRLFFVALAQVSCNKIRDSMQKQLLMGDNHAPNPHRVNGVVMNSVAFATTFQCKNGTRMNPVAKCKLW